MAYGSPDRLADVPAYYADIRGGRPIAPEHLEDLVDRYRRLGIEESNPLNAITEETRARLAERLGLGVFTGMKHWTPHIDEAADRAVASGADTVVGLVLAPHYSGLSIAGYRDQLERGLAGRARLEFVESWHDDAGFVAFLADRIRGTDRHVVFTAHSLPARILAQGDPYRDQLLETSALVAEAAAVADWSFSFQSESPTGEPWLGPDILDHLAGAARRGLGPRPRLSGRVRLRPSGDPLGHRHRGAGEGGRARDGARTDRDAERRARLRRRARADRAAAGTRTGRGAMTPGQIVVDRVSQRFRVSERPYRTLKDTVSRRRRAATSEVWALRDVSLAGRAGRGARAGRAQRLRQDDAAEARLRHLQADLGARSRRAAGSARCSSSARASIPDFTGRENVYLNGSIHGLSKRPHRRGDGRDRLVRRARARSSTCRCAPTRRACTCGSGSRSPRTSRPTCCCSTRSSRSATRSSSASASARSTSSRAAAARSSSSRTTRRRSSGSATGPSCSATARSSSTAPTREAIAEYRRLLAGDRSPDELAAGLREWGSGEARIVSARLLDAEGDARDAVRRRGAGDRRARRRLRRRRRAADRLARAPRPRRARPRRDDPGDRAARLGRRAGRAGAPLRDRATAARRRPLPPPLRADRGPRRPAPAPPRRRRSLLRLPGGRRDRGGLARGALDAAGDRDSRANRIADELAHLPRLAPADGARTRVSSSSTTPLREAQLPADALVTLDAVDLDAVAICCDLDRHVFFDEHTDPRVAERAARVALVRPARVGRALAGPRRGLSRPRRDHPRGARPPPRLS